MTALVSGMVSFAPCSLHHKVTMMKEPLSPLQDCQALLNMSFHFVEGHCWRPQSCWDGGFAHTGDPLPDPWDRKVSSSQELLSGIPHPDTWAAVAALPSPCSRSFQTVLLQCLTSQTQAQAQGHKGSPFLKPPPTGHAGWPSQEYGKDGMTGCREAVY